MSEMHSCFESVVIIITLDLHASFMNIHHNTFIKYILEDDSIFQHLEPAFVLVWVMVGC
jgi:hypothetical protein